MLAILGGVMPILNLILGGVENFDSNIPGRVQNKKDNFKGGSGSTLQFLGGVRTKIATFRGGMDH
jgi:hypothetical protein